jgi:hypothetical protein
MNLLRKVWDWSRPFSGLLLTAGREKPDDDDEDEDEDDDHIAIQIGGQGWDDESGEPFPEGPEWDELRKGLDDEKAD